MLTVVPNVACNLVWWYVSNIWKNKSLLMGKGPIFVFAVLWISDFSFIWTHSFRDIFKTPKSLRSDPLWQQPRLLLFERCFQTVATSVSCCFKARECSSALFFAQTFVVEDVGTHPVVLMSCGLWNFERITYDTCNRYSCKSWGHSGSITIATLI